MACQAPTFLVLLLVIGSGHWPKLCSGQVTASPGNSTGQSQAPMNPTPTPLQGGGDMTSPPALDPTLAGPSEVSVTMAAMQNLTTMPRTDPVSEPSPPPTVDPPTTEPAALAPSTMPPTEPASSDPTAPPLMTDPMIPTEPEAPACPSQCTCNMASRTVTCGPRMATVPSGIPEYVNVLDLSQNSFSFLHSGAFLNLPNLVSLRLVSCSIQSIQDGAFTGLTNLRILNLKANHLAGLDGVLAGLPALEQLDMEQNRLEGLSRSVLNRLPNLRSLSIGNNPSLSQVDADAFQANPLLETLSISHCNLAELPTGVFRNLTGLQSLSLTGNPIVQIPGGIFGELSSLEDLQLSSMALSSLGQESFGGLPALRTLNLANNDLANVDGSTLEPLVMLDTLVLSENPWDCDCRMSSFLTWLIQSKIDYSTSEWRCTAPSRLLGRLVFTVPSQEFACVPIITSISPSKTTDYQQLVYFECRAIGDPIPQIEWYQPGGERVTATSNDQDIYTSISGTALIIRHPTESSVYNCTARNANGVVSATVSLTVVNIPTTTVPTTTVAATTASIETPPCVYAQIAVKAADITDTTIRMEWTQFHSPLLKGYLIQINEFGAEIRSTRVASEDSTSYLVSNLEPGKDYIICVSVWLSTCPSFTTLEHCKQLTTAGSTDGSVAAMVSKHRNEIIGTALATFLGTLFILASIFVILWQYRKPKSYDNYDFNPTTETARFADLGPGDGLVEGESGQPSAKHIRYTGSLSHDNLGAILPNEDERLNGSTSKHEAEVYSIPPDAQWPIYGVPNRRNKGKGKGKGKGKSKRESQMGLVAIEMEDSRRHSDYMVPSSSKEEDAPVLEARVIGQDFKEDPDTAELGHLYEEVDGPKCKCDPVVNGIIVSNGHVPCPTHPAANGHARTNSANSRVRFSLPDQEEGNDVSVGKADPAQVEVLGV